MNKKKTFFREYVPASVYSKDEPPLSMHHECYSSYPVQKHSSVHLSILDSSKHPRNERMHDGRCPASDLGSFSSQPLPTQNDNLGSQEPT